VGREKFLEYDVQFVKLMHFDSYKELSSTL